MFLSHLLVPPYSKMLSNNDVKLFYFTANKSTRIKEGGEK